MRSRWLAAVAAFAWIVLVAVPVPAADAAPTARRQVGATDGLWYWQLPDTPNGLVPVQAWSGAGSAPDGAIYVAGMDHVTNAALYRLGPEGGSAGAPGLTLAYVGDARAASQAVGNLRPGEGIEKFHTHPTWLDGRVYLPNLNHSTLDAGYLEKRGFHWYAYDESDRRLLDLSADRPGGAAVAHGGLVSIAVDRGRGVIYGAMVPTGDIYAYDVRRNTTRRLGRPDYRRPYVYAGRAMWTDARGRLYFTAGAAQPWNGAPYDPAIFDHVHAYDPAAGRFVELTDWRLHEQRAIDTAQCFPVAGECYLADGVGRIYRFLERDPETGRPGWQELGKIWDRPADKVEATWVLQVNRARTKAYLMNKSGAVVEFDLGQGRVTRRANLFRLEPRFANMWLYGYDAWDAHGRFYFAAFGKPAAPTRVSLVAIDPERFFRAAARR
ncbi:hypothetical protein [Benzoatithermus flavus]|uniref:Uncharacterized protein n=1 Tax=Benzoatithermus flavus TaxID=3108223 RepID=A0ABU8XSL6_9PROT